MKELKIETLESCTGCTACAAVCAHSAITMEGDSSGFMRPRVHPDRCTGCGLCDATCPELTPIISSEQSEANSIDRAVYAATASHGEAQKSASGGVATSLCREVLKRGGVVYGCAQKEYSDNRHCRITDPGDLHLLRGSKYVQSCIGATFAECKADLAAGREVMYVGTPCQIAGLRAFLRKDYPNLFTVDLVCHGVPSQQLLDDDVERLRQRHQLPDDVTVEFRDKTSGKVKFGVYVNHDGKRVFGVDFPNDYYISAFMRGLSFRPNCFSCRYACSERAGDITLGDFWGLGTEEPSALDPQKGVSLVICNTKKGEEMFAAIKPLFTCEKRTLREAVNGNHQLRHSFVKPRDYDAFHAMYAAEGYEAACSTYLKSYIRDNNLYAMIEKHPILMLPYRIWFKIKGMCKL